MYLYIHLYIHGPRHRAIWRVCKRSMGCCRLKLYVVAKAFHFVLASCASPESSPTLPLAARAIVLLILTLARAARVVAASNVANTATNRGAHHRLVSVALRRPASSGGRHALAGTSSGRSDSHPR